MTSSSVAKATDVQRQGNAATLDRANATGPPTARSGTGMGGAQSGAQGSHGTQGTLHSQNTGGATGSATMTVTPATQAGIWQQIEPIDLGDVHRWCAEFEGILTPENLRDFTTARGNDYRLLQLLAFVAQQEARGAFGTPGTPVGRGQT